VYFGMELATWFLRRDTGKAARPKTGVRYETGKRLLAQKMGGLYENQRQERIATLQFHAETAYNPARNKSRKCRSRTARAPDNSLWKRKNR
jgi:hypothetical protein